MPDYDADSTVADNTDKHYGLIAQEVKAAMDKLSISDFGGWHEIPDGVKQQGIAESMFIYPLIKAVQELSAEVEKLKGD